MADANVMLRIGSKLGPGGLASLQAGLSMVREFGGAMVDAVSEADKFALSMQRVDMAMVNMADSAAAGQIDTAVLIKQLAAFKEAAPGVELTAKQLATISARAADFAEASGKDATEVFERMTNGIMRAESEALKPFGIKLKENIDMSVTQNQAIRELTDGFEDFEYQAKTNTQRMKQLNNNWDTFKNLLFQSVGEMPGVSSGLSAINEVLGETNKALSETSEAVSDYVFEFDTWGDAILRVGEALHFVSMIMNMEFAEAGKYFSDFVTRGTRDANLLAARQMELAGKRAAEGYGLPDMSITSEPWTAGGWNSSSTGGGGGGGGGDSGSDVAGEGMRFYDVAEDEFSGTRYGSQRAGSIGYGGPDVSSGRFGTASEWNKTNAAIQESVDAQMELLRIEQERWSIESRIADAKTSELESIKMQNLETQARIELLENEEYQAELAQVMEEERNLAEAERRALVEAGRADAITFSGEFTATWVSNLDLITDRIDNMRDHLRLVGQTWKITGNVARQSSLIAGTAIGDMVEDSRVAVLVESILKAALATADAVEAFASEQYAKGALYTTAATLYTVSAAKAGSDMAKGGGGVGNSKVGYTGSAGQSSFAPSHGGAYMQNREERPEQHVIVTVDDRGGLYAIVQRANSANRREGSPSFSVDAA
jgi:hypothetical protein